MSALESFITDSGQATRLNVLGIRLSILAHSRQTGGTYSLVLSEDIAGGGPPPHLHGLEDETFHVLEGEYEITDNGRTHRLVAGATAFLPRNGTHQYRCLTPQGRMLVLFTPGGFERFFEEVGAMSPAEQQDIPRVVALGRKYGLEFMLPVADHAPITAT
jgi:quercetin dioxygenase-like cupin family protein